MIKDIRILIDGICEAHAMALDGGRFAPKYSKELGRLITHCNEAVNYVAKRFGYHRFNKMESIDPFDAFLANEQHTIMETDNKWIPVKMPEVQVLANQGAFVVASLSNEHGPGHVAIIRPGTAESSGSWGQLAPKCLNIGSTVFIHKKASWAFRSVPLFFVLDRVK